MGDDCILGLENPHVFPFLDVCFRSTPHPVTVTTRIITFLVGNPYKPSFATVTGWGVDPMYAIQKLGGWFQSLFLFVSNLGEMIHFDYIIFCTWVVQPPTLEIYTTTPPPPKKKKKERKRLPRKLTWLAGKSPIFDRRYIFKR